MIDKFFKPTTISEAIKLKDKFKKTALYYAGGTQINSVDHSEQKRQAISLELLKLNYITQKQKTIFIGSTITLQQLIDSNIIPKEVKNAAKYMTNRNIRNMATVGGNIAVNKSCSNLIPILIVSDAKLKVSSTQGEEIIDIINYINTPNDYLILNVIIPIQENRQTTIDRFTRSANDISILNVAVSFIQESKTITDIRMAIGGVSRLVIQLTMTSIPAKDELEIWIKQQIDPIDDIRGSAKFKSYLAGVMVSDSIYSLMNMGEK